MMPPHYIITGRTYPHRPKQTFAAAGTFRGEVVHPMISGGEQLVGKSQGSATGPHSAVRELLGDDEREYIPLKRH
jgi:hypothetical protein